VSVNNVGYARDNVVLLRGQEFVVSQCEGNLDESTSD
jgi:hypothetical protein